MFVVCRIVEKEFQYQYPLIVWCGDLRKWNLHLWKDFFDSMLNVPSCDNLPDLPMFREEFEDYFKTCVVEDRETWMDDLQKLGDVVGKME